MSQTWLPLSLRNADRDRAEGRCEYCRMPESGTFFPHETDHVIAIQHGGETTLENLALACIQCNRFKGPNIASVDPQTKRIVPLFNPRADKWSEHFCAEGGQIIPLTVVARSTAALLNFGDSERVETRKLLSAVNRPQG